MIPEGWRKVAVQDIAKVLRGASPRPKSDPRYYGGNVPRLMVSDVTRDGKYVTPRTDFLTEAGAKLSRPMPKGTLVIVCSGTVGVPTILNVDCCIHDGFLALYGISKDCDVDYLYEIFSFMQTNFDASATHGGIFTNLTTEIVREFEFFLPSIKEQRKIAEILSTWDKAIELLEQLIAMKRKLKQGLMQQLLTGRRRFKEFEGSEWEFTKIEDIAEINPRKHPKDLQFLGEFVEMASVSESGQLKRIAYVELPGVTTGYTPFINGDTLIAKITPCFENGKGAFVKGLQGLGLGSTEFHVLRSRQEVLPKYLYYLTRTYGFKLRGTASMQGSGGQQRVPTDFVSSYKVKIPPFHEQQKIVDVLYSADAEISTLEKQLSAYKQQKRGLMQQLLTGKKRVASPPSTVFDSGRPLSNFVERGENLA